MAHSCSFLEVRKSLNQKDLPFPWGEPTIFFTHAAYCIHCVTCVCSRILSSSWPSTISNYWILSINPSYPSPPSPHALPKRRPPPKSTASQLMDGWTTCPTTSVVPGQIGKILWYEDYYFESKHVLCTQAFSVAAVSTTVDNGESSPGSTKLDNKTGHNCRMSKEQYQSFCRLVNYHSEGAHCNLILQDLDAMKYYFDTDWKVSGKPVSLPGNITDMARILAKITLLLIRADACTSHIINKVWGKDNAVQLALGGPQGDLLLVWQRIFTHQKVAINTVYICLSNPSTPILPPDSAAFKCLSHTIQQLLLDAKDKRVFAREPVPSGARPAQWLTDNLQGYLVPYTLSFKQKAVRWFGDLLLRKNRLTTWQILIMESWWRMGCAPLHIDGILPNWTRSGSANALHERNSRRGVGQWRLWDHADDSRRLDRLNLLDIGTGNLICYFFYWLANSTVQKINNINAMKSINQSSM